MSFVNAAPEYVEAAATDLANIGSTINAANAAAAAPTTGVLAAGADEVSAAVCGTVRRPRPGYQALSAQAAAFHSQFVQLMNAGAASYCQRRGANASPMQQALNAVNAPAEALFDAPADRQRRQRGPRQDGGAGGLLFGNGGNGGPAIPPESPAVAAGLRACSAMAARAGPAS